MVAIDYTAEMAYPVYLLHFPDLPNLVQVNSLNSIQDAKKLRLYELIMGAVPPTYTWTSVPAISGSMGVLSLSTIKDENIGDGNTIYGQPLEYIKTLAPGSRIETIATNLTKNEQKTIIYSGNFYRMDILRSVVSWPTTGGYVDISTAVLKFYLNPTTGGVENLILAYSVPFGVDANGNQVMANYLGIIIDVKMLTAGIQLKQSVRIPNTSPAFARPLVFTGAGLE